MRNLMTTGTEPGTVRRAVLSSLTVLVLTSGFAATSALIPATGALKAPLTTRVSASPFRDISGPVAPLVTALTKSPAIRSAQCPDGSLPGDLPTDLVRCVHEDKPPPGVNVHAHVPTSVLVARRGARAAARQAVSGSAAVLWGATTPSTTTAASTSNVPCDGDGTSGYRVQALYVVEAGQMNRFATLKPNFELWAAGVDSVISSSAAKNGGVRHVRFVTEGTTPSCTAKVTSVTVPVGSLASLSKETTALSTLGYNHLDRKYLLWTDSNVLCGIGTIYPYDQPEQQNPNNGAAGTTASYSRVDPGCWGMSFHSTEAHELTHNLGGVQAGAPNATTHNHCTDESDLMCYSDNPGGTTPAMVQVCPQAQEVLQDCNGDDYFSTLPKPGSWLAAHWNVASSRWLIGGGDGASFSGEVGTLRADLTASVPVTPGVPAPVSVAVTAPLGHGHTVSWSSMRSGCAVTAGPTGSDQGLLTCDATAATSPTQISATVTDTTSSVTTVASAPIWFANAGFTGGTPTRVLDTRTTVGGHPSKLGAGQTMTLTIPGLPTGTTAVALNVTVTGPTAPSTLTVYPGGQPLPLASNLNFVAGQTIPNMVLVGVGPNNTVTFRNSAGTVNVIADLLGHYR